MRVLLSETLFRSLDLENFAVYGILIVEMCYQLSLTQVDAQSMINWSVVGQLTMPTSDGRPLVYHSDC